MKLSELLKDTDVLTLAAPSECEIGGVSYDSRKVKPGDAFVAISGFETDGYKYIPSGSRKRGGRCYKRQSAAGRYPLRSGSRLPKGACAFKPQLFPVILPEKCR